MSKRDELAAVLGKHLGKCMRFGLPCSEVRPRDQWCGRCDLTACATDAVLAWLGEQFGEGLRNDVGDELAPYLYSPWKSRHATDAALAVVRTRLGLSDASQDAQDGARTASEVEGGGAGCHSGAARPGEVHPCDSEGER